jgi:bifunctional UDP-N-acetylglucosamine pyrophosphorylase/glucosamine-1-phosphate N-acetyltransferase
MAELFSVVLAAGKGTRMKSDLAKVLHPLAGRPMIHHVLDTLRALSIDETVVVVGHQADAVRQACEGYEVETVLQEPQLGTGHAVQQAESRLAGRPGCTLVVCGDVPLLSERTLRRLVQAFQAGAAGVVLTAVLDDPGGYGRIVRNGDGHVTAIVEHKDATDEQRAIAEINTGTYCFDNELLWPALRRIDRDNAQKEFYVTDVVGLLVQDGRTVSAVVVEDPESAHGINSTDDLARAERTLGAR